LGLIAILFSREESVQVSTVGGAAGLLKHTFYIHYGDEEQGAGYIVEAEIVIRGPSDMVVAKGEVVDDADSIQFVSMCSGD
jgi:hypothetical protein